MDVAPWCCEWIEYEMGRSPDSEKMFQKKTDEDDCSDPGVQCIDDSMTL